MSWRALAIAVAGVAGVRCTPPRRCTRSRRARRSRSPPTRGWSTIPAGQLHRRLDARGARPRVRRLPGDRRARRRARRAAGSIARTTPPATLRAFQIDLMPVTQAAVRRVRHAPAARRAPAIDEATWKAQGFEQDFATEVARFVWHDGRPPPGREDHPVVLVTWDRGGARTARGAGEARPAAPAADRRGVREGRARRRRRRAIRGATSRAEQAQQRASGPARHQPVGSTSTARARTACSSSPATCSVDVDAGPHGPAGARCWSRARRGTTSRASGAARVARPRHDARHVIVGFRCAARRRDRDRRPRRCGDRSRRAPRARARRRVVRRPRPAARCSRPAAARSTR